MTEVPEPVSKAAGLFAQRKLDEAEQTLKDFLAGDPDNVPGNHCMGAILCEQQRVSEGVIFLRKASTGQPGDPNLLVDLGRALVLSKQADEAATVLDQAALLQPKHESVYHLLGVALEMLDRTDEAVHALNQSLTNNPADPEAAVRLSILAGRKGYAELALGSAEHATKLAPSHPGLWVNRGDVSAGLGQHEDGIQHYEKSIRLQADFAPAHERLVRLLEAMGRKEKAVAACRRWLQAVPNDTAGQDALTRLQADT